MSKTNSITQSRLKELLSYDPETGIFTWIQNRSFRMNIGDIAGSKDKDGYILIAIDYVKYKSHRLAFLYMTGEIPVEVDHVNHVKNDNRWANLCPATHTTNQRNRAMQKDNKSGLCGVYWKKQTQKWFAQIQVDSKQIHLGYFDDWFEAVCARKSAENKYDYHDNHGC